MKDSHLQYVNVAALEDKEDPLTEARGMVNGIVLSLAFWGMIGLVIYVAYSK